ncbi:MAG: hypothetical protein AB1405_10750 [Bdellovibrionota bacterium]
MDVGVLHALVKSIGSRIRDDKVAGLSHLSRVLNRCLAGFNKNVRNGTGDNVSQPIHAIPIRIVVTGIIRTATPTARATISAPSSATAPTTTPRTALEIIELAGAGSRTDEKKKQEKKRKETAGGGLHSHSIVPGGLLVMS